MSIKVLHTADWHLGKKLFRFDRLDEQKAFLSWLLDTIQKENIDALLMAGDIFDTFNPPNQAIYTFFKFLKDIGDIGCQSYFIAGNHDSGHFLENPLPLAKDNIHIVGHIYDSYDGHIFQINKKNESIQLACLPYFRYQEMTKWDGDKPALDLLKGFFDHCHKVKPGNSLGSIFMSHHLFGNFQAAGSEQVISLTGLESIPLELLKDFQYVALGHIHKPQIVSKESPKVVYSGSPIPMRFSEKEEKSVSIIEFHQQGKISYKKLPIPQSKHLIQLRTNEESYILDCKNIVKTAHKNTLVEVLFRTTRPIPGKMDQIRALFQDSCVELASFQFIPQKEVKSNKDLSININKLDTLDLFKAYYSKKYPESSELPDEIKEDFLGLLSSLKREDNEISQTNN